MENEKIKQGDTVLIKVDNTGSGGEGVGRVGNFVVFVPYALPGETVSARITFVKKNYATAILLEVVAPSPDRIEPKCNRFGRCGGCAFLNLQYAAELKLKKSSLAETLKKGAGYMGAIADVVPSDPYGYRNKLQLPFGVTAGAVSLGFYRAGTHKVVSTGRCALNGDWAETLIAIVKCWANAHRLTVCSDTTPTGLLRHLVARNLDGKLQVTLVLNGAKIPFKNELLTALRSAFPDVTLYLNVNRDETNVIFGKQLVPVDAHPQPFSVMGIEAELNPFSFLQVNDTIRDRLYRAIANNVSADGGLRDRIVVDAYAGIGILGAVLAKNGATVFDIEIVPEATRDGERLSKQNGVADRVEFLTGDAAAILPVLLPKLAAEHPTAPVTVVLDPPRKGCGKEVVDALNRAAKTLDLRVLYVSCNPATLARDLSIMRSDFQIESVTPFDMFPRTPHVETLVVLRTKKSPNSNSEESPTPGIGNLK